MQEVIHSSIQRANNLSRLHLVGCNQRCCCRRACGDSRRRETQIIALQGGRRGNGRSLSDLARTVAATSTRVCQIQIPQWQEDLMADMRRGGVNKGGNMELGDCKNKERSRPTTSSFKQKRICKSLHIVLTPPLHRDISLAITH